MAFNFKGFKKAIETEFTIVNKDKIEVPFILKRAQEDFLIRLNDNLLATVLKARKMGFSSVALAIAVLNLILGENERCVSMSFDATAASKQLERAKHFIKAFEIKNKCKIPFKYNSKYELVYEGTSKETGRPFTNTLRIGTAKSGSFGRGDDITFLHLTEVAFCTNMDELTTGVMQAVVNDTPIILETTANGFNDFKKFWDKAVKKENMFNALFYGSEWEYSTEFLDNKKKELGERLYHQEYPSTPEEAFLTSGDCYFDTMVISELLKKVQEPIACQFV